MSLYLLKLNSTVIFYYLLHLTFIRNIRLTSTYLGNVLVFHLICSAYLSVQDLICDKCFMKQFKSNIHIQPMKINENGELPYMAITGIADELWQILWMLTLPHDLMHTLTKENASGVTLLCQDICKNSPKIISKTQELLSL